MRHFISVVAMLLVSCGQVGESANNGGEANVSLEPGQWEVISSLLAAGTQQPPATPSTIRFCLTAEQIAQPSVAEVLVGPGGLCQTSVSMNDGRVLGWRECGTPGSLSRHGIEGRYSETAFEVYETIDIYIERRTGRRIGECPSG